MKVAKNQPQAKTDLRIQRQPEKSISSVIYQQAGYESSDRPSASKTDLRSTAPGEIDFLSRTSTSRLRKQRRPAARETDLRSTATGEIDFLSRIATCRPPKQ